MNTNKFINMFKKKATNYTKEKEFLTEMAKNGKITFVTNPVVTKIEKCIGLRSLFDSSKHYREEHDTITAMYIDDHFVDGYKEASAAEALNECPVDDVNDYTFLHTFNEIRSLNGVIFETAPIRYREGGSDYINL